MVLALVGACSSAEAEERTLTGKWTINIPGGATYYFRQVGDEVWWMGDSKDDGKTWTNIGHGHVKGNELTVKWADVPRGRFLGSGTVTFKLVTKGNAIVELQKTNEESAKFGGDKFTPQK
jgi:hypothetical protein